MSSVLESDDMDSETHTGCKINIINKGKKLLVIHSIYTACYQTLYQSQQSFRKNEKVA